MIRTTGTIVLLLTTLCDGEFLRAANKIEESSSHHHRQLQQQQFDLTVGTSKPLGMCEGDCDTDDDCQAGLYCLLRERNDPVPGCRGTWSARTDFCVPISSFPSTWPSESPSSLPSQHASTNPSDQPSDLPSMVPSVSMMPSTSTQPSLLPSISMQPSDSPSDVPSMIPTETMAPSDTPSIIPTNLPSFLPTPVPTNEPSIVPSNPPSLQPSAYPSNIPSTQPSILPSNLPSTFPTIGTSAPTFYPTPEPTLGPTPRPTPIYAGTNILNFTGNGLSSYGLCQGDCDNDNDCDGNLVCFQRDDDNSPVPGCVGMPESNFDYCIAPTIRMRIRTTSENELLNLCEGECLSDDDCAGTLVCYIRYGGRMQVPGCLGGSQDNTDRNFCTLHGYPAADPPTMAPTTKPPTEITVMDGPFVQEIRNIHLKLYWEQGYDWQEVYYDLNFCMNHDYYVGWDDCWYGWDTGDCVQDQMYISTCRDYDRQLFDILVLDDTTKEAWITTAGENRCFTRILREVFLRPCDATDQMQRWIPLNGPWDNYRFEIVPKTKQDICMTQSHHPKAAEVIELKELDATRAPDSLTSFWNTY